MDNPQGTLTATESELGWLAGMIDGEGTVAFSVHWRTYVMNEIRVKPQIIVCGTDRMMIERVAEIIGKLGVGVHVQTREAGSPSGVAKYTPKFRQLHVASVVGFKRAIALLSIISPYLFSVKRQKSEMMLRYMTRRLEKTALRGRCASLDVEDLTLMLEIMRYSAVHNGKGPGPKYIREIERHLRDLKQSSLAPPREVEDIVRATARAVEGQREAAPPLLKG